MSEGAMGRGMLRASDVNPKSVQLVGLGQREVRGWKGTEASNRDSAARELVWEGRDGDLSQPEPCLPEPSGMALTNVGSIFTEAVGLVSFPKPFSISAWNRAMMSTRVSSESRI